jgi:hypothetical protein
VDVGGVWTGEYRLERGEVSTLVTFTLHLTQGLYGRVHGTVQDGPGGMPEEGRITGWCWGRSVRLRKLMPVARLGSPEGGTMEMSAYFETVGRKAQGPHAHPPIRYRGRLSDDGASMSGTWHLSMLVVPLQDGYTARIAGEDGTWSARRG